MIDPLEASDALERFFRDVATIEDADWTYTFKVDQDWIEVKTDSADPMRRWGGWGQSFEYVESGEALVVAVADWLQDGIIDDLYTAWPPCPGHGHPRDARVVDGLACWVCPAGSVDPVRIGDLGAR